METYTYISFNVYDLKWNFIEEFGADDSFGLENDGDYKLWYNNTIIKRMGTKEVKL